MRNFRDIHDQLIKKENDSSQNRPLTIVQVILLEIMQLLPVFTVYGMLELTDNVNVTMAAFFSGMCLLPLIYCFIYKKDIKSIYFGDGYEKIGHQLKQGAIAGAGVLAVALGSYYGFLGLNPGHHSWVMSRNIPVEKTFADTAIFFCVFSFVNPIMEEFFWRAFVLKSYSDRKLSYVLVSIHYAIYHWFSVYYITKDCLFATVAFIVIFGLGVILMYLREKSGMIAAVVTHVGADMAVAIIAAHIYSGIEI